MRSFAWGFALLNYYEKISDYKALKNVIGQYLTLFCLTKLKSEINVIKYLQVKRLSS